MSSSYLTRVIGGVSDRRVVLNNSAFAETIAIGTNWSQLHISARISMTDSGGSLTSTPKFYAGLMSDPVSGLTNGPLGSSGHFIGFQTDGLNWTRSTGPVRYAALGSMAKKIGATITDTSAGGSALFSADPGNVRNLFTLYFTKGSPNWTCSCAFADTTAGVVDHPDITWLDKILYSFGGSVDATQMEAFLGTVGYNNSAIGTISIDEGTDGPLNAIVFAWNRTDPLFEISDIAYRQMIF